MDKNRDSIDLSIRDSPISLKNIIRDDRIQIEENLPKKSNPKEIINNNPLFSNLKGVEDFNVVVDQETKVSYEHQNKYKMNLINEFLLKKGSEKFKAKNLDYRNIYVIVDGTIVLNHNRIPGKYFNIIKRKVI